MLGVIPLKGKVSGNGQGHICKAIQILLDELDASVS